MRTEAILQVPQVACQMACPVAVLSAGRSHAQVFGRLRERGRPKREECSAPRMTQLSTTRPWKSRIWHPHMHSPRLQHGMAMPSSSLPAMHGQCLPESSSSMSCSRESRLVRWIPASAVWAALARGPVSIWRLLGIAMIKIAAAIGQAGPDVSTHTKRKDSRSSRWSRSRVVRRRRSRPESGRPGRRRRESKKTLGCTRRARARFSSSRARH